MGLPRRVQRAIDDLTIMCRDHDSSGRYNLVAGCYDKRMNLISIGMNNYSKTHPKQFFYGAKSGNSDKCFLHAEIAAIVNAKNNSIDTIITTHYTKKVRIAKPCASCMLAIMDAGIKHIYYTIAENEVGYIKL